MSPFRQIVKSTEISINHVSIPQTPLAEENDGFRYVFVAIDMFPKFVHVVPMKSKPPAGVDETMDK
eukprot:3821237-Amphidinium_carterae.1